MDLLFSRKMLAHINHIFARRDRGEVVTNGDALEVDSDLLQECQRAAHADEDGDLPLHLAVVHEHVPVIEKLMYMMFVAKISLDHFNNLRQTPLHLAVITRNVEIIKKLLHGGANPNLADRRGSTCVHLAIEKRTKECLEAILMESHFEVDLDAKNYDGFTPLHISVLNNLSEYTDLLLTAGANVDVADGKSGRTALFHAAENKSFNIASLLLQAGASVNISNYSGNTAVQAANGRGHTEMVALLIKYGADASHGTRESSDSINSKTESKNYVVSQNMNQVKATVRENALKRQKRKQHQREDVIYDDLKSVADKPTIQKEQVIPPQPKNPDPSKEDNSSKRTVETILKDRQLSSGSLPSNLPLVPTVTSQSYDSRVSNKTPSDNDPVKLQFLQLKQNAEARPETNLIELQKALLERIAPTELPSPSKKARLFPTMQTIDLTDEKDSSRLSEGTKNLTQKPKLSVDLSTKSPVTPVTSSYNLSAGKRSSVSDLPELSPSKKQKITTEPSYSYTVNYKNDPGQSRLSVTTMLETAKPIYSNSSLKPSIKPNHYGSVGGSDVKITGNVVSGVHIGSSSDSLVHSQAVSGAISTGDSQNIVSVNSTSGGLSHIVVSVESALGIPTQNIISGNKTVSTSVNYVSSQPVVTTSSSMQKVVAVSASNIDIGSTSDTFAAAHEQSLNVSDNIDISDNSNIEFLSNAESPECSLVDKSSESVTNSMHAAPNSDETKHIDCNITSNDNSDSVKCSMEKEKPNDKNKNSDIENECVKAETNIDKKESFVTVFNKNCNVSQSDYSTVPLSAGERRESQTNITEQTSSDVLNKNARSTSSNKILCVENVEHSNKQIKAGNSGCVNNDIVQVNAIELPEKEHRQRETGADNAEEHSQKDNVTYNVVKHSQPETDIEINVDHQQKENVAKNIVEHLHQESDTENIEHSHKNFDTGIDVEHEETDAAAIVVKSQCIETDTENVVDNTIKDTVGNQLSTGHIEGSVPELPQAESNLSNTAALANSENDLITSKIKKHTHSNDVKIDLSNLECGDHKQIKTVCIGANLDSECDSINNANKDLTDVINAADDSHQTEQARSRELFNKELDIVNNSDLEQITVSLTDPSNKQDQSQENAKYESSNKGSNLSSTSEHSNSILIKSNIIPLNSKTDLIPECRIMEGSSTDCDKIAEVTEYKKANVEDAAENKLKENDSSKDELSYQAINVDSEKNNAGNCESMKIETVDNGIKDVVNVKEGEDTTMTSANETTSVVPSTGVSDNTGETSNDDDSIELSQDICEKIKDTKTNIHETTEKTSEAESKMEQSCNETVLENKKTTDKGDDENSSETNNDSGRPTGDTDCEQNVNHPGTVVSEIEMGDGSVCVIVASADDSDS